MASLTYGLSLLLPGNSRSLFVTFSVKSRGASPSQCNVNSPRSGWAAATALVPADPSTCPSFGLFPGFAIHDDQSFRNQRVGKMCTSAASGPRFTAVIFTRMSSGPPFAYSTKTSKYRSPSKTPVSRSSYSISSRVRFPFVRTRSS